MKLIFIIFFLFLTSQSYSAERLSSISAPMTLGNVSQAVGKIVNEGRLNKLIENLAKLSADPKYFMDMRRRIGKVKYIYQLRPLSPRKIQIRTPGQPLVFLKFSKNMDYVLVNGAKNRFDSYEDINDFHKSIVKQLGSYKSASSFFIEEAHAAIFFLSVTAAIVTAVAIGVSKYVMDNHINLMSKIINQCYKDIDRSINYEVSQTKRLVDQYINSWMGSLSRSVKTPGKQAKELDCYKEALTLGYGKKKFMELCKASSQADYCLKKIKTIKGSEELETPEPVAN